MAKDTYTINIDALVNTITNVKKWNIWKILLQSLKDIKQNKLFSTLAFLMDATFLFVFGIVFGFMQIKMLDNLYELTQMASGAINKLPSIDPNSGLPTLGGAQGTGLANDPLFMYHMSQIVYWIILLVFLIYLIWCIFEGLSWFLTNKVSIRKSQSFATYMGNFALQSILFFVANAILGVIMFKFTLFATMSIAPLMAPQTIADLTYLLMVVLWYFGFISFSLRDRSVFKNLKNAFKLGLKNMPRYLLSFSVMFLLLFIASRIDEKFFLINKYLGFATGMLLIMPLFVFSKALLFNTTELIQSKKPKTDTTSTHNNAEMPSKINKTVSRKTASRKTVSKKTSKTKKNATRASKKHK